VRFARRKVVVLVGRGDGHGVSAWARACRHRRPARLVRSVPMTPGTEVPSPSFASGLSSARDGSAPTADRTGRAVGNTLPRVPPAARVGISRARRCGPCLSLRNKSGAPRQRVALSPVPWVRPWPLPIAC
jgi:hypothetical protein